MIHLNSDCGSTGETFSSWEETFQWIEETTGNHLSRRQKTDIRKGNDFKVGSRYYSCEKQAATLANVA